MPLKDDPFGDFCLNYVPGECLICHRPCISNVVCQNCLSLEQSETVPVDTYIQKTVTIGTMAEGTYGYVDPREMFYHDRWYFINIDAEVVSWPSDNRTVKVRRSKNDHYSFDPATLSPQLLGRLDLNWRDCPIIFPEKFPS